MDTTRFDTMARLFERGTRRGILRLMAGTTLGATLLAQFGAEEANAKCVKPGKKCKKKSGKKRKCCGGAKCKGKKCKCTGDTFKCGKTCCQPGQECQDGTCVNGSLEAGAHCDPETPLECQTGNCQCISNAEITQCTCRQAACFDFGVPCENTSQCCSGGCEGFTNTCLPIEF